MKKIAFTVSVGLNIAFLLFVIGDNSAIYSGYFRSFFEQDDVKPRPSRRQLAFESRVSQFEELPVTTGDTVFLGDSITERGLWHELFPGSKVRNRGISGAVSSGTLARIDDVSQAQPGQLFLLIGTNDLTRGTSEAEIVANILSIIDELRTGSPNTEIYLQSVLPRTAEYREKVESLNQLLQKAIKDTAVWIDLYPIFLDDDGSIRNTFSNDELHLNGQGYLAWRDHIRPLVTAN